MQVFTILLFLLATGLAAVSPVPAATGSAELVIAKPFGPSVAFPDPARGYNGWYTSEAGVTQTLFALDFDMNLVPLLAESARNVDPRNWAIRLRRGIRFHDNSPMDAHAVKASFLRIIDPDSPVFNKRLQGLLDIDSIRVVDDHTLIFVTRNPNSAFLSALSAPGTAIVKLDAEQKVLYGTGPFVLDRTIPGEEMVVSRFAGYWGETARLARVYLKTVRSPATRMLAFASGQVDMVLNYPDRDAARLGSRNDVQVMVAPTVRLCFFFVRVADGLLADPRIRRAINLAIDRRQIVDTVLAGVGGEPASTLFPRTLPWSNRSLAPYPFDPARAGRLLAEAGAVDSDGDGILEINGHPLHLEMWTYEGRAALKPTLELVQVQLQRVGIGSSLHITRKASPINQAMRQGRADLGLQMWNAAPQGDPDYFISRLFTSTGGANFMGYHNREVDELVKKGRTTFDGDKRKKIYDRIQEIIRNDSPVIVLFHKSMITVASAAVQNYRIHPAEKYLLSPLLDRR